MASELDVARRVKQRDGEEYHHTGEIKAKISQAQRRRWKRYRELFA